MHTPNLDIRDLGLVPYEQALGLQKSLVQSRKAQEVPDTLLLLEHPTVYTIGRKGQRLQQGNPVESLVNEVAVERGGESTFHNPGQLVAYPILGLVDSERDVAKYLRHLELVLITLLKNYGLETEGRAGATGVWLVGQQKKIASIGVALTGWVTYHGIALNVDNDLAGFARIQPCGFSASVMTSLKEVLGTAPSMSQVKQDFVRIFADVFKRQPSLPIASTGQAIMASSH